jgi:hypothetical protein
MQDAFEYMYYLIDITKAHMRKGKLVVTVLQSHALRA